MYATELLKKKLLIIWSSDYFNFQFACFIPELDLQVMYFPQYMLCFVGIKSRIVMFKSFNGNFNQSKSCLYCAFQALIANYCILYFFFQQNSSCFYNSRPSGLPLLSTNSSVHSQDNHPMDEISPIKAKGVIFFF